MGESKSKVRNCSIFDSQSQFSNSFLEKNNSNHISWHHTEFEEDPH